MSKYYNFKEEIDKELLSEIINILNNDGLIIFPTDTVYGLGGNALSEKVIEKIYQIKKRPLNKALNILVKNKEEIEKYAYITNDLERKIIDKFMPGAITLILKKKDIFPRQLTSENDTIGIRIPDNNIIKKILDECDYPLAAPSANITGDVSPIKLEDIQDIFNDKVSALIDGGICKEKISSTIVEVENNKIKILREGTISLSEIKEKLK